MGIIYDITKNLSFQVTKLVKSSLIFSIINKIILFFEYQFINSLIFNYWPENEILFNKSHILKEKLFSPLLLILVTAIFLLLCIEPLSGHLHINLAIAMILFIFGVFLAQKSFLNGKIEVIKFSYKEIYDMGFALFLLALFFFFLSIAAVGGIPLFKSSLRYLLKPAFTIPVFLMVPALGLMSSKWIDEMNTNILSPNQVKFRMLIVTSLAVFIFLLLGYRTPIVAVILMVIIIGYYSGLLRIWEILLGFLLIIGIIGVMGYIRLANEYYLTNIGIFSSLMNRADFTLHVLDKLSFISGSTGFLHGKLTLSLIPGSGIGPRVMIAEILNWRSGVTITPTLYGPMLVEFGTIGLAIVMFILGFILNIGHKIIEKTKEPVYIVLYALIFSYVLLGIETGILDQTVITYLFLTGVLYLFVLFKNYRTDED